MFSELAQTCSGDMETGLPSTVPVWVRCERHQRGDAGAVSEARGYFFFGSREIVTLLIVTGVCGLSCMPVGTFAIS